MIFFKVPDVPLSITQQSQVKEIKMQQSPQKVKTSPTTTTIPKTPFCADEVPSSTTTTTPKTPPITSQHVA